MATVDWLRQHADLKVGVVQVVCFRPFPSAELVQALAGVPALAVVERMERARRRCFLDFWLRLRRPLGSARREAPLPVGAAE